MLMEPVKSTVNFIEYMGRVRRLLIHNQKEDFACIDCFNNISGIA